MAVAATLPAGASVYSTTAGDSYATSSWTGAGAVRTYICFVQFGWAASADKRNITVTGNGLTWTQIGANADFDSLAAAVRRCAMFRARGTASTGATTADCGAGNDCTGGLVVVVECNGVDGTTNEGVVQGVLNPQDSTASPHVVTLAAFASATNGTLACFVEDSNSVPAVEGGGYASVDSGSYGTPNTASRTEFLASQDTTPSVTATTVNFCGMAVELAELVTAAPGPSARRRQFSDTLIDPRGWN